jgi:hypothetical protein
MGSTSGAFGFDFLLDRYLLKRGQRRRKFTGFKNYQALLSPHGILASSCIERMYKTKWLRHLSVPASYADRYSWKMSPDAATVKR